MPPAAAVGAPEPRGVRLRLADVSRRGLADGSIHRLVAEHPVTGIALDTAAVGAALSEGVYGEQLAQFAAEHVPAGDALLWAMTDDARTVCDLLAAVHDSTARTDGRVSLAVDPRCARDTEGTLHDARRLRTVVGRDNLYVGVPATAEGMSAMQALLSEGVSVDATNICGLERLRQVLATVLAGLEQAAARGRDLTRISAALSLRVADVDAEVARLTGAEQGRVAAALADAAGRLLEQTYAGDFWRDLQACGARPIRMVWDTTVGAGLPGADTLYVERMLTAGGVIALSSATLRGLADHGAPSGGTHATSSAAAAGDVLTTVERHGVRLEGIAESLEDRRIRELSDIRESTLRVLQDRLAQVST